MRTTKGSAVAAQRAADALLATVGGRMVQLRIPVDGIPGDVTEQLGLATPEFRDVALGPVAFRKARGTGAAGRYELIVSATAVEAMVGSLGYESVAVLFGVVAGVLVGDRLLYVESCRSSEIGGEVYCYRIGVREPVGVVV